MSLLVPWLVFPATLGLLALGCGLLLERVAAMRLPAALILPSGFAAIIVIAGFTTHLAATAAATIPLVVGLAAAGLATGVGTLRGRGLRVPLLVASVVFAVFGAPVLLSGEATFAGYIKLDDTATFLALTDRILEHGSSLSGLAPSSYEATLAVNLGHSYPAGALLPFGIARDLVGVDGAWVYQPYLAFAAALLAVVLYGVTASVIGSRGLRAVLSVVAAQPALLYGYALWGGIKELVAAPLVALLAALIPGSVERLATPRRLLPPAFAAAAVVGVLSLGGAMWFLASVLAVAVLAMLKRIDRVAAASLAGLFLVSSVPTLLDARSFFDSATSTAVRSSTELGNLVRPLSPLQVFGVWPSGDFRFAPSDRGVAWMLICVTALAAVVGLASAWRRRARALLLYVGTVAAASAVIALVGSPWVVAKAYAIASPAFVLAALLGCAAFIASGRETEGVAALIVVAGGVLWSNALAYHEANLAPRAQLAELESIGQRFAGAGPALMTEYQPYGVRHFLRRLDAEGASELRRRQIPLRDGRVLGKGAYADLASFRPDAVSVYRTLVLRRSPFVVAPDGKYGLVWRGRFYDVWQRGAAQTCGTRALARRRTGPLELALDGYPGSEAHAAFRLTSWGRYSVWVGGSFRKQLSAFVDGSFVGAQEHQLNNAGQYTRLGDVTLARGEHALALRYEASPLTPGSGGREYGLGPVVLSRAESRC